MTTFGHIFHYTPLNNFISIHLFLSHHQIYYIIHITLSISLSLKIYTLIWCIGCLNPNKPKIKSQINKKNNQKSHITRENQIFLQERIIINLNSSIYFQLPMFFLLERIKYETLR